MLPDDEFPLLPSPTTGRAPLDVCCLGCERAHFCPAHPHLPLPPHGARFFCARTGRDSYYSFADDFTSNLKNSDALLQVSLACSTRRDGRVLLWLKKHELAVRSAILTVLADTPEGDVYLLEGKNRLQRRLTAAINKVLSDREGFGGVDAVYFRSFIIQ